MPSKSGIIALVCACSVLGGCASQRGASASAYADRFGTYNKKVHRFNSGLHRRVLHPVGKAADVVVPDIAEEAVGSVFENLSVPNTALNNLAQGKPKSAGQDLLRFGVNSTVGVAGLFDLASRWGIPEHEEDFGQTLRTYGVAPGPYVVLPLVGGMTPRALLGGVVSADPMVFVDGNTSFVVENVGRAVGLAKGADMAELPPYEAMREYFYARRNRVEGAEPHRDDAESEDPLPDAP